MPHTREASLNTRVSRFRDGYDHDESFATNEQFLRSRDSSPAATSPGRTSCFREHNESALGTTLFSANAMAHSDSDSDMDLSRPETHYDPHTNRDTAALLAPTIRVEKARGTSQERDDAPPSDEERLLAQARKHADAHVDAYVQQQRRKEAGQLPAPQLSSSRGVYVTRWLLRIVSCGVSIAIVAALLDTLNTHSKTKDVKQAFRNGDGGGIMNVWPELMKMHPTLLLLCVAATAAALSLLLSVASVNQRVRRMTKTGNIATITISAVCLALWIATTAYYASWDTEETHWDLMSWSCKHRAPDASYNHVNYGEICIEMRFAFWAAVGLAGLEFVNLMLFVVWYVKTRRARKYARLSG
ncbi:hypothetical protein P171DRAFT_428229 [Karstenula rhodostoma CBS 690.94]|uniref:MARVEL domain-containing protein n=1 Tax=Karstenula rhodostoma CBS 690.94 TaxID=1392251 RepID=A0A9P4PSM3_9PLEO|nr:hypothetical protein P171DRAFT_428229 [Karstenula rhodostoma CBS 690.94]